MRRSFLSASSAKSLLLKDDSFSSASHTLPFIVTFESQKASILGYPKPNRHYLGVLAIITVEAHKQGQIWCACCQC